MKCSDFFSVPCKTLSAFPQFDAGVAIVRTQFSQPIFSLYMVGVVLGTIYSVPPFQFKRIPILAGSIISVVRGFLLNFGVYYAVRESLSVTFQWNPVVTFIASFMTVFASVIAVTKVCRCGYSRVE
jgi:homogentisate solanesyltransferase